MSKCSHGTPSHMGCMQCISDAMISLRKPTIESNAEENEDCSHELRRVFMNDEWAYQCQKCEETFYILPCKLKKQLK